MKKVLCIVLALGLVLSMLFIGYAYSEDNPYENVDVFDVTLHSSGDLEVWFNNPDPDVVTDLVIGCFDVKGRVIDYFIEDSVCFWYTNTSQQNITFEKLLADIANNVCKVELYFLDLDSLKQTMPKYTESFITGDVPISLDFSKASKGSYPVGEYATLEYDKRDGRVGNSRISLSSVTGHAIQGSLQFNGEYLTFPPKGDSPRLRLKSEYLNVWFKEGTVYDFTVYLKDKVDVSNLLYLFSICFGGSYDTFIEGSSTLNVYPQVQGTSDVIQVRFKIPDNPNMSEGMTYHLYTYFKNTEPLDILGIEVSEVDVEFD